ncbi:phosphogluconate dehydratase [Litorivicinus lipolyticus]|uniref:Phosphogluconate dehydratase n=1 Tax=Litorivicinus lipolyticus TaxID=418701 RepID=A0A5Q2QCS5_9GAMM|nr:phosphogluconate dehydratase [Litorivicinus lipolyticus]QGG79787.1 phosphogluconate dehydratase [Litorivicinus lipolyticus]
MHPTLVAVTERIIERSRDSRARYLAMIDQAASDGPIRGSLSCGNLAHGFAACGSTDKQRLKMMDSANIAIISSYNDMLSAHQPLDGYPEIIKKSLSDIGSVGQFAGGVPAMCDGVTQGRAGMELSLLSRDVIAQATAVSLSHDMFDGMLLLGVCDKIVPGLLIGALRFGHLPAILVPAGPMPSGLPNKEKVRIRQLYAEGKIGRDELLEAESASYHSPGTCTFYGTANTNQMMLEIMGLMLPGAAFENPGTEIRDAITRATAERVARSTHLTGDWTPMGRVVDEKSVINGLVGLLATGGSTNHTLHMVAIAAAAGIRLTWEDFDALSAVVPLLCQVYPNGQADVNHFKAAGGMPFVIRELLDAGLLHDDVTTVVGRGMRAYTREAWLNNGVLDYRSDDVVSGDLEVVRPVSAPFQPEGGMKLLNGNLGKAIIKISAVHADYHVVEAPAVVFEHQDDIKAAFEAGDLNRDCIVVVRGQGPQANGMPELHKLTPFLGVLQDKGYHVALVTDGRMSGASGKVPAAIHLSPEGVAGGLIGKVRDGDVLRLDATTGELSLRIDAGELAARDNRCQVKLERGMGRELFAQQRPVALPAELGGGILGDLTLV